MQRNGGTLRYVAVTIAGQGAPVDYFGSAPQEVAGVFQLNTRIPAGTPPGAAPVTVTIGAAGVSGTVAVR